MKENLMLDIPSDLNAWHPNDIAEWSAALDDDPTLTDTDRRRADRAVSVALLGEETAAEIHGPEAAS
jgi:hypothetical protein